MIKSTLLVFTRAPVPGQTKTRLIPLLGAQGAAEFHQTVLQSTLAVANVSDFVQSGISRFRAILSVADISLIVVRCIDIG